jgi:hypothetical protein
MKRHAFYAALVGGAPVLTFGLLGAIAMLLAGCGANSPLAPSSSLVTFTQADLAAATAEATAAGDTQAVGCFSYLSTNLTALSTQAGNSVAPVGVFSAFEGANIALTTGNSVLSPASKSALENACGPLVLHAVNTALSVTAEAQMIAASLAAIK